MKPAQADVSTLPVVETFHSIQGEGFWTGTNAFFIRLAGCDVGCPWCDTKHSWSDRHPLRTVESLVEEAHAAKPAIVVVTGGEPLMHDLTELTEDLCGLLGLPVHLETSGTHPHNGSFEWVTLSPKSHRLPLDRIYSYVDELKVVISKPSDLDWAETEATKAPQARRSLQPEWSSPDSYQLVHQYVLSHPEWRISLQTHKYTNIQ
jgi:organic radical activating enzyme